MKKSALIPLELVNPGDWADVEEVTGEPDWVGRLAELGVRSGSRVLMVRSGSPCLLQVDGSRLSLRGDLSTQVLVRTIVHGD